jgi:hypothetical protein
VNPGAATVAAPAPGTDPSDAATVALWRRLARPFALDEAVDALFGLSVDVVAQLMGVTAACCEEAELLLDRMPRLVRSLTTSVNSFPVRTRGEIRGPILWSETVSARAATAGDPDLFVCTAAHRDHDTPENRVLVRALAGVVAAGASVDRARGYDDASLRRARENGRRARVFLDHPALKHVSRDRLKGNTLRRAMSGKSARTYAPAFALYERLAEPVAVEDLLPYRDRRTSAQHRLVVAVVDELERRGLRVPPLRTEAGVILAGPVTYVHPRRLGRLDRLHGVLVGEVLLDVPDRLREHRRDRAQQTLDRRAGGRLAFVVMDPGEVPAAVDRAVEEARRKRPEGF